jgi:hypothetical protein
MSKERTMTELDAARERLEKALTTGDRYFAGTVRVADLRTLLTAWNTRPVEPCRECAAVSAAIGGCEFMDPPDGGDVSLSEQVRRMREALNTRPSVVEGCSACYRGEVFGLSTDDGFWVEMGASAGGAHAPGMNGWLELIEHHPDGTEKRREYVATDSLPYARPSVVPAELAELSAKATQGPWRADDEALVTVDPVEVAYARSFIADVRYFTIPKADANAAFIAATVNYVRSLLASQEG